jgi:hypothetical protein
MYLKIEEKFIQESKLRMSQLLFVLFLLLLSTIYGLLLYDWIISNYLLAITIMAIAFYSIVYLFVVFYLKVSKKRLPLRMLWNVPNVIEMYKQNMHEQDIKILRKILNDNNVKSKENIKEVMHHYRALLPRNIKSHSAWLSVAAFAISVIAFLLNDTFLQSNEYTEYLKIGGMIFVSILLVYAVFLMLNASVFQMFGKDELYKRLEASITEIYINTPDEETRVLKKTSLRKHKCTHK